MQLWLDRTPSPIGCVLVVWDNEECIRAIDFEDFESRMHVLLKRYIGEYDIKTSAKRNTISASIDAYFEGDSVPLQKWPVKLRGTGFQRCVWEALQEIPSATTISYGALAQRIGKPTASRAVGLANGANPIAIRIPCHRVIGANGSLTGYGGGVWRKKWLISHETKTCTDFESLT